MMIEQVVNRRMVDEMMCAHFVCFCKHHQERNARRHELVRRIVMAYDAQDRKRLKYLIQKAEKVAPLVLTERDISK